MSKFGADEHTPEPPKDNPHNRHERRATDALERTKIRVSPAGLVSARDAAEYTRIAYQTLANMRTANDESLPWRHVRNRVFYHIDDLRKFVGEEVA